jgi:hypothetical protein
MLREQILGLRHEERRHGDRRHLERTEHHRRRSDRRRSTLRGLVFGMFAMALPHHGGSKTMSELRKAEGFVSVSEDYRAVPAAVAYDAAIAEAADRYRLDPNLIRAVINAESAFNPFAVSSAGALGLMQLMPAMAAELEVLDPFDPRQNILGGSRYLRDLLDRHHGNVDLAVASYNAGPGAVARYRGIPPYRETRNYVKTVNTFIKQARTSQGD